MVMVLSVVQPGVTQTSMKDYQQFLVVRRMVWQFTLPIAIAGVETARAEDSLALTMRRLWGRFNSIRPCPARTSDLSSLAGCGRQR
ncbi:pantoate--beta-alanine ligase [Comamonas odontotermitis]|uniref:pantoate--beta-alanine ligase n=2 Tax=Comamonas odontotermitis TaxID=379895 RepID=UPI00366FB5C2